MCVLGGAELSFPGRCGFLPRKRDLNPIPPLPSIFTGQPPPPVAAWAIPDALVGISCCFDGGGCDGAAAAVEGGWSALLDCAPPCALANLWGRGGGQRCARMELVMVGIDPSARRK